MSAENKKPRPPMTSDATGAFTPDDLAKLADPKAAQPAVSDATGSFAPDDLARMNDGTVVQNGPARPAPAVSDATGAFTPDDLARMEGKKPTPPPPVRLEPARSPPTTWRGWKARRRPRLRRPTRTGVFTPDDLSRMTTDTVLSGGHPPATDSAVWGATGEFTLDGQPARPADGTHHGGNVGMATGTGQGSGEDDQPGGAGRLPPRRAEGAGPAATP